MNGKIYIGKTATSVGLRWNRHWKDSGQHDTYFYRALRKYGKNSFSITPIETVETNEEACELEKIHIAVSNSYRKRVGYNTTFGGDGGTPTEEVRRKQGLSRRGNQHRKGKLHSQETKDKMSASHAGEKCHKYRHDLNDQLLSDLYGQGYTSRQIADILRTGKTTVLRRLRNFGINLRPQVRTKKAK